MNYLINNNIELGQTLYYCISSEKNIYKPCPVCDNKRTVSIDIKGGAYEINCPRCTRLKTKGDDSSQITIKQYKVDNIVVKEVNIRKEGITFNGSICIETLTTKATYWSKSTQFYVDKEECVKVTKSLNKDEKKKADDFLKSLKEE